MLQTPSLEDWLALDTPDFAVQLQTLNSHLALLISVDGTRRHYLVNQKSATGLADFRDYAVHTGKTLEGLFDMLFSHGVQTILHQALIPGNFERSGDYLSNALKYSEQLYVEWLAGFYQKHRVKARLVGDWDIGPISTEVKTFLRQMQDRLTKMTPQGEKLFLIGYQTRSHNQEQIDRSVMLSQALGRIPTEVEVKLACFPDGPAKLDILIGAGWLSVGLILPSLLDSGATDIYNLAFLTLDLDTPTLRRILYDSLFRRRVTTDHGDNYAPEDIEKLRAYYTDHKGHLVGLGRLVGPGIWYAEHP